jgi:Uma2 family endonuclease
MMIASKSRGPYFTPEEYLQFEETSAIKHEYREGLVFAMAGAKKAHIAIVNNLSGLLFNHLRSVQECVAYTTDIKVKLFEGNGYYYPDVAVTCDERDQASNSVFIEHPKLIIEVLSDSTEAFDRGDKFEDYKAIAALEEYVLVHQKQVLVERFWRRANGLWLAQTYSAGEKVEFGSIGFVCPIAFLYEKVEQFLKSE